MDQIRVILINNINSSILNEEVKIKARIFINSSISIVAMIEKMKIRTGQIEFELNTAKEAEIVIDNTNITLHLLTEEFKVQNRLCDIPMLILKYS